MYLSARTLVAKGKPGLRLDHFFLSLRYITPKELPTEFGTMGTGENGLEIPKA